MTSNRYLLVTPAGILIVNCFEKIQPANIGLLTVLDLAS